MTAVAPGLWSQPSHAEFAAKFAIVAPYRAALAPPAERVYAAVQQWSAAATAERAWLAVTGLALTLQIRCSGSNLPMNEAIDCVKMHDPDYAPIGQRVNDRLAELQAANVEYVTLLAEVAIKLDINIERQNDPGLNALRNLVLWATR